MCNIFQNSYLTIAAAESSDSQGGLYILPPKNYLGEIIESEGVNEDHIPSFVRRRLEHYPLKHDVSPDFATYYGFPLLGQAWVYQELLLAPRVLYFSPQELI
jgi:hypothetical protein